MAESRCPTCDSPKRDDIRLRCYGASGNYDPWHDQETAPVPQPPPEPEINDKAGWDYNPDESLRKLRAEMAASQPVEDTPRPDREKLAEWFFNRESEESESDDRKLKRIPQKYARWPEDASKQPYCKWAYARADAFLATFGPKPLPEHDCDYFNEVECLACNAGIPKPGAAPSSVEDAPVGLQDLVGALDSVSIQRNLRSLMEERDEWKLQACAMAADLEAREAELNAIAANLRITFDQETEWESICEPEPRYFTELSGAVAHQIKLRDDAIAKAEAELERAKAARIRSEARPKSETVGRSSPGDPQEHGELQGDRVTTTFVPRNEMSLKDRVLWAVSSEGWGQDPGQMYDRIYAAVEKCFSERCPKCGGIWGGCPSDFHKIAVK